MNKIVTIALTVVLILTGAGVATAGEPEWEVRCVGKQCHRHYVTDRDRAFDEQNRRMLEGWRHTLFGGADIHDSERGR